MDSVNTGNIYIISQEKQGFSKTQEKHLCNTKPSNNMSEDGKESLRKGLNERTGHGA